MKTLNNIQKLLSKTDLKLIPIFQPIQFIYQDYDNDNELYNTNNKYKKLIVRKYSNKNFINEYNNYYHKFNIFKNILNELNGKLYYKKELIDYRLINSFFIPLQIHDNSNNIHQSAYTIYVLIDNKKIEYQYLYFEVDKEKTAIINYLGFLNKFQYNIIYNSNTALSLYYKNRLIVTPFSLDNHWLRESMNIIFYEYLYKFNLNLEIIKSHWLLSEWTKKDELYYNKALAQHLLKKI